MSKHHLFYRIIEKIDGHYQDSYWSVFEDINVDSKLSGILHAIFNYDAGDVYAWPCDNIEKEEVDRLWYSGQRSFVFDFGYKEAIIYDIRTTTEEEYAVFMEEQKSKRTNLINEILELFSDNGGEDLKDLENYTRIDLEKILRKYKL